MTTHRLHARLSYQGTNMTREEFMARLRLEVAAGNVSEDDALPHLQELIADADAYRALHTPEVHDFLAGITREAIYQRRKWSGNGDAGKTDADWLWLIGYLSTKALLNPHKPDTHDVDARAHRIITVAAAALNWHAATIGRYGLMHAGLAKEPSPQAVLELNDGA